MPTPDSTPTTPEDVDTLIHGVFVNGDIRVNDGGMDHETFDAIESFFNGLEDTPRTPEDNQ